MSRFIHSLYRRILFFLKRIILFLTKVINFILAPLSLIISFRKDIEYIKNQRNALALFYDQLRKVNPELQSGTSCIIFSMDRAIQLHALLGTLREKLSSPLPIYILYRSSSVEHKEAYAEVERMYSNEQVIFIEQSTKSTFKSQLISIIDRIGTDKLFFLVDDILVTDNIEVSDFEEIKCEKYVLSLRLGKNLTSSYNAQAVQPLPSFLSAEKIPRDTVCWKWNEGMFDWGYPLSVDGHVFLTKEMRAMVNSISFNSPNTFEGNLQLFKPIFDLRLGLAYSKSKLFNIPCNKVQEDNNNLHGKLHQSDLLKKWQEGYQIDYRALYDFVNVGVHQDVSFTFVKRTDYGH